MSPIDLILVEDDRALSKALSRELGDAGFSVRTFHSGAGVIEHVRTERPQVALVDLRLPDVDGMQLLERLGQASPELQVVMLTGHGGVPEAVRAVRLGAYDFLVKPTRLEVLEQTLRRAAEKHDLLTENSRLRRLAESRDDPWELIGASRATEALRRLIDRIGPSDAPVLVHGENGTGKELIARNLHRRSERREGPFLILNCGAFSRELVESELFGHERGAFTGAERRKVGLFEAADGGSLVLDEIGELPPSVQPTLLRALQFGEVRRVGSNETRTVDVRIIASTNRDLNEAMGSGGFREDLYYRLATFEIRAPALRERPEDVAPLARAFLADAAFKTGRRLTFDESALRALAGKPWPGNVRELGNVVTRLSVLADDEVIDAAAVERHGFSTDAATPPAADLPTLNLETLERLATRAAMIRFDGDKPAAARELGVSLRTLYNKLKTYGD